MRVDKRYRGKPLPRKDIEAIAVFSAELQVYAKLRERGWEHAEAMARVFVDDAREDGTS